MATVKQIELKVKNKQNKIAKLQEQVKTEREFLQGLKTELKEVKAEGKAKK